MVTTTRRSIAAARKTDEQHTSSTNTNNSNTNRSNNSNRPITGGSRSMQPQLTTRHGSKSTSSSHTHNNHNHRSLNHHVENASSSSSSLVSEPLGEDNKVKYYARRTGSRSIRNSSPSLVIQSPSFASTPKPKTAYRSVPMFDVPNRFTSRKRGQSWKDLQLENNDNDSNNENDEEEDQNVNTNKNIINNSSSNISSSSNSSNNSSSNQTSNESIDHDYKMNMDNHREVRNNSSSETHLHHNLFSTLTQLSDHRRSPHVTTITTNVDTFNVKMEQEEEQGVIETKHDTTSETTINETNTRESRTCTSQRKRLRLSNNDKKASITSTSTHGDSDITTTADKERDGGGSGSGGGQFCACCDMWFTKPRYIYKTLESKYRIEFPQSPINNREHVCGKCYRVVYLMSTGIKSKPMACSCCGQVVKALNHRYDTHSETYKKLFPGSPMNDSGHVCSACSRKASQSLAPSSNGYGMCCCCGSEAFHFLYYPEHFQNTFPNSPINDNNRVCHRCFRRAKKNRSSMSSSSSSASASSSNQIHSTPTESSSSLRVQVEEESITLPVVVDSTINAVIEPPLLLPSLSVTLPLPISSPSTSTSVNELPQQPTEEAISVEASPAAQEPTISIFFDFRGCKFEMVLRQIVPPTITYSDLKSRMIRIVQQEYGSEVVIKRIARVQKDLFNLVVEEIITPETAMPNSFIDRERFVITLDVD